MTLGLVGVLAICALMFVYMNNLKQSENVAQSNQQAQAQIAIDSDVCRVYPDQELCVLARKIAANPTEAVVPKDGAQGEQGPSGRGVSTFSTTLTGDLEVTYTDGKKENVGRVVGKNGIDGTNGKDGRGILAASVENGSLIVRFSDGVTQNLGIVVGPAGANGTDGATGPTGPAGAAGQNGTDGKDGVNGTNGTNGADGISVIDLKVDDSGTVTVYYSNDTQATAGQVIVSGIKSMTCDTASNVLTITSMDGSTVSATVDCSPDNIPNPVK
jgi:hypothetical protein